MQTGSGTWMLYTVGEGYAGEEGVREETRGTNNCKGNRPSSGSGLAGCFSCLTC